MPGARLLSACVVVGVALVMAGCESSIRARGTEFVPEADGAFLFTSFADTLEYPVDDPDAEATRMRWLRQYIEDNQYCPTGQYEITERTPILVDRALLSDGYTIVYRGQCTP